MKNIKEEGSITLETALVLPIFFFMFLFIYGLFSVYSSQNRMTHALIQSAKSLSLDSYMAENVESAAERGTAFWGGFGDMVIDFVRLDNDPYFASSSDWYEASEMGGADSSVIKKRFMGFLGGNEEHAKELLDDMKIVGGMDGIQFETSMDGENLTIKIKYKMQYWFDFFDMGKIPIEQKITTRMWK